MFSGLIGMIELALVQECNLNNRRDFLALTISLIQNYLPGNRPKTPRRRITVMSSLTEISRNHQVNRVMVRGGGVTSSVPALSTAGFWTDS
jgi:hypothetical protein